MRPPYSPFLNIVERVISALKAAIKAGYFTSCHSTKVHDKNEARTQGIPALGEDRYEYHSDYQMCSMVQIYADVHTTISKARKHKLVIGILLMFMILLNALLNL